MKTRQLPSTTTTSTTASFRAKQWDATRTPAGSMSCEREQRHEAAKREREEQQKRERALAAVATAAQRVRQHRKISAEREQPANRSRMPSANARQRQEATGAQRQSRLRASRVCSASGRGPKGEPTETLAKAEQGSKTERDRRTPETPHELNPEPNLHAGAERLRTQLEELAQLPEQQFEQGFRKWLDQEGIAREMHSHLRVELINCFNNTALGQLLNKAAGLQIGKSHALLHSPLAMALPTLVAEFLHSQNCHFTLSVFCSEMPQRHMLPKFENRPEFRFRTDELQQVLGAVLGAGEEEAQPDVEFNRLVEGHYVEDLAGQTQSLLMALMRSLVEIRRLGIARDEQEKEKEKEQEKRAESRLSSDCASQTEPAACLEARPEVDTSRLYQTEEHELILGADGRSVFVGARVSQSLHSVEQQMSQLMKNLRLLTRSCAPPVEVISEASFEQLLQRELRERERLTKAGQSFNPGEPVIKLPPTEAPKKKVKTSKADDVVYSDSGPIILPAEEVELPRMLPLHPEQLSSLAVIRQSLDNAQKKNRQPQGRMYVSVQRMETLMGDVCGCVQLLGNVLNLSMEQEHAVGQRKGFEAGYREGFGHGHFMGLQEGQQKEQNARAKNKKESSAQVEVSTKSKAAQTTRKKAVQKNTIYTQTKAKTLNDAATQAQREVKSTPKSYDQWIHEMLHSSSGKVFLERVELSLNKALELQKQRLDELYLVKLRHQAEMLRLSRRKISWRSLCRRVERDSQSSAETQDLVQKIFSLLEHHESHHHLLVKKIQQTEIAAEQATCIVPMWAAETAAPSASASGGNPVKAPSAPDTSVDVDPQPSTSNFVQHLYPSLAYPFQLLAVPATGGGIPPSNPYMPVDPRLTTHCTFSRGTASVPGDGGGALNGNITHSTVSKPSILPRSDSNSTKDTTVSTQDTPLQGAPSQGAPPQGAPLQGAPLPGAPLQGAPSQGAPHQGAPLQGAPPVSSNDHLPVDEVAVNMSSVSAAGHPVSVSGEPLEPPVCNPSAPASGSFQECTENPLQPKPPVIASVKPSVITVGTNTVELPAPAPPPPPPAVVAPPIRSVNRSSRGPSFEEALLSAKNRMKQLEEESDLLEQSFLSYLEKSKSKTHNPRTQKSNKEEPPKTRRVPLVRELEQLDHNLDNVMDWHRRIRSKEDAASLGLLEEQLLRNQPVPPAAEDSKMSSPRWLSEPEEAHDQDKYHFTNAISEARKKLLAEISLENREAEEEQQVEEQVEKQLPPPSTTDWTPTEMPKVLSVVRPPELADITPSRSSSNGEMTLLLRRAKAALGLRSPNPLLDSSSDSSSLEAAPSLGVVGRSPSRKFQQSMAKMELLFGGASVSGKAKLPPRKSSKSASRPLSAPTTGVENMRLPQRPHTAPTLYPIQEGQQSFDLQLDSTTTSTSQSSLPPARSFEELVANAVMGPDTTPEVSYSQEFWKRMNL